MNKPAFAHSSLKSPQVTLLTIVATALLWSTYAYTQVTPTSPTPSAASVQTRLDALERTQVRLQNTITIDESELGVLRSEVGLLKAQVYKLGGR